MRAAGFAFAVLWFVTLAAGPAAAQTQESKLGGKSLAEWAKDLKDPDPAVVENAIRAVVLYGKGAQKLVGHTLVRLLSHSDASIRTNAANAIGVIGLDAADVPGGVTELIKRATPGGVESQGIVRLEALTALGRLGNQARLGTSACLRAIKDGSTWGIRRAAAYALGTIAFDQAGQPYPDALQALARATRDSCGQVRMEAVNAIISLGQPPNPADRQAVLRLLHESFDDKDRTVVVWLHVAIMKMDRVSEAQMRPIARLLKDRDPRVRTQAAIALGKLAMEAESHVSELIAGLADHDGTAAAAAASALLQMKQVVGDKQLEQIAKLLEDRSMEVRSQAALMLGMLGTNARSRIPDLIETLRDKEPNPVISAAYALGQMGDAARKALPELKKAAGRPEESVRYAAQAAIEQITRKEGDAKKDKGGP